MLPGELRPPGTPRCGDNNCRPGDEDEDKVEEPKGHLTGVEVPEEDEGWNASTAAGITSRRPTDLRDGRDGRSRPREAGRV